MKRVYRENFEARAPKALAYRGFSYLRRNRRALIGVLACALAFLFLISCLLVLSESRVSPAVAMSNHKVAGAQGPAPEPPSVYADAAALIDLGSGRVLYEKNSRLKMPMASTTKMMTALVVRDQLALDDKVTVSPEAASIGEQEIWLDPGETLTVKDLLYALIVQSANDAAYALAQSTAGSIENFAQLMNAEAQKIGAKDSHFTNPHGLDDPNHYSTAYDLAVIGRELLKDPVLAKMASTSSYEIPWPGHPGQRVALSHNEFLNAYQGANGIKTGYTLGAGWCLVGSATRNGVTLIAVALNSSHRASDVATMLDYGFSSTSRLVLVKKGQVMGRSKVSSYPRRYVDVLSAGEVAVLSVKGANDVFSLKISYLTNSPGSVKRGTKLGTIECLFNGASEAAQNAVASRRVDRTGLLAGLLVFFWYAICKAGHILGSPFGLA